MLYVNRRVGIWDEGEEQSFANQTDFPHICQCNSLHQYLKKEQALKKCTLKEATAEVTSVSQSLDQSMNLSNYLT